MAMSAIAGKPGTQASVTATPIEVFYGSRPTGPGSFIPGPVTVDGTVSADAGNTPYVWTLRAGHLLGKDTTSGKYESSIIGICGGAAIGTAYTSGGTTLTVSAATAVEIVRRIGSSGTFNVIGPPSAAGTVATTLTTFSAVNTTTGAITVTSLGVNKIAGSFIAGTDGSQTPTTLVCDQYGLKIIDGQNTTRQDVYDAELFAGQGILDETKILPVWPTDTSLQSYIKNSLRTNFPGAVFRGDIVNS